MRGVFHVAVLLSLAGCVLSARILALLPFPGKSHHIFSFSVLQALSQRGHYIVEYSPFPPSKPMSNYTHIEVHTEYEEGVKHWTYDDFLKLTTNDQPRLGSPFRAVWHITLLVCEEVFKHETIQKLLKSNEHFDLVITESSFGQESMVMFGHKFRAPTVTVQSFFAWNAQNRDAGNALSIASIPDTVSMVATERMCFAERAQSLASTALTLFYYYYDHLPRHERIIRQHYRQDIPPLADLMGNISLYLINTHPNVEYPQPYTPNIIPIAGITISSERTPLPQNLQKFMDESKEGVVYFSFGTVVPVHLMPSELVQIFVNVFKKLPQKVIWKTNLESIPGLSKNVMLVKWVPQPGILAHPNCVLFLTHGGLLGQQEAFDAGVPVVAIPFFGDQEFNVRFYEYRGVGVKLDFRTLSEQSVSTALSTVLNNPKYRENARRLSRIFRDRPMSPADSAVFWVEYVLRHGGGNHLRSAASRLAWYQLALLDVLAVCLAAVLSVLTILYLALTRLLTVCCNNSKQKHVPSSKKKN